MSHLLKFTEWQDVLGNWHCNDTSDLGHGSGYWWNIPRMLDIELTEYILLLKDTFHATNFSYSIEHNVLLWKWENYQYCHNFTLFVNKEAKKRKFFI